MFLTCLLVSEVARGDRPKPDYCIITTPALRTRYLHFEGQLFLCYGVPDKELVFESHQSHVGCLSPDWLLPKPGSAMGPVGRLGPHNRTSQMGL